MPKIKIGGIMQNAPLAEISVLGMPARPGTAAAILGALGRAGLNVRFIVQCADMMDRNRAVDHVVFCVNEDDLNAVLGIVEQVKDQVQAGSIVICSPVAVVSIFGPDFRERPGIAGTMFEALAGCGINIQAISTSISTVSCVIDAQRLGDAVAALERAFELP